MHVLWKSGATTQGGENCSIEARNEKGQSLDKPVPVARHSLGQNMYPTVGLMCIVLSWSYDRKLNIEYVCITPEDKV